MFNLYSTPDLKAAVDDALPWSFDKLGFNQNYVYEFVRLGLSYAAVAAAALTYWVEKKQGWDAAYSVIASCVLFYFASLTAAYLLSRFVERRAVYIGSKAGETVYARSEAPKHQGIYVLHIDTPRGTQSKTVPFNEIVDFSGHVANAKLQSLLAELVKPKNE